MEPCREVMRFHRLALRTEEAFLQWIKRFLVFCRDHPHLTPAFAGPTAGRPALSPPFEGAERERHWRRPQETGETEVEAFLTHLAAERNVSASTQNGLLRKKATKGLPRLG